MINYFFVNLVPKRVEDSYNVVVAGDKPRKLHFLLVLFGRCEKLNFGCVTCPATEMKVSVTKIIC